MLGQILLYPILFVLGFRTLTLYYFGIVVPYDVYILLWMDGWYYCDLLYVKVVDVIHYEMYDYYQ